MCLQLNYIRSKIEVVKWGSVKCEAVKCEKVKSFCLLTLYHFALFRAFWSAVFNQVFKVNMRNIMSDSILMIDKALKPGCSMLFRNWFFLLLSCEKYIRNAVSIFWNVDSTKLSLINFYSCATVDCVVSICTW